MSDPILTPADDDAEVIPLRPAPFGAPDITADPTGDPSDDAPDRDDADDLTDAEGDDNGEDGAEVDRESVLIGTVVKGAPVDPPDEPHPFGRRAGGKRAPVLPPWIASRTAVRDTARWTIREIRYYLAFHSVRAPK